MIRGIYRGVFNSVLMDDQYLKGCVVFIVEQGLGKTRAGILSKQVEVHGGCVVKTTPTLDDLTHIVVSEKMTSLDKVCKILKVSAVPTCVEVVKADWLSACLVAGQRLEAMPYFIRSAPDPTKVRKRQSTEIEAESVKIAKLDDSNDDLPSTLSNKTTPTKRPIIWAAKPDSDQSSYEESDEEEGAAQVSEVKVPNRQELEEEGLIRTLPKKGKWLCQIPSSQIKEQVNINQPLTDKLEELLGVYQSSSLPKDQWRAMSLKKALAAIKKHPKPITSYEDARSLPFVGDRLADKIHEIVTSGHLRRLDVIDREKESVIELFLGIHGVGKTTAEEYYAKDYRTLEDLRKANVLNRIQLIGLKYYDEFKDRMPRTEVKEIEDRVRAACHSINDGLIMVTCGSYRRGKETCGDVDILVTHPDGRSHRGVFGTLLKILKDEGFLTDDLTIHDDKGDGTGCKYLGVCKLSEPPQRKHRRIDIYTCPYSEYPLMLLHFTGSGHFNRSMRNKADKMGMSLSEHSLNAGVIRKNGVKVFEGTPLPVSTEKDVFDYLDIPYLEPTDRDLA